MRGSARRWWWWRRTRTGEEEGRVECDVMVGKQRGKKEESKSDKMCLSVPSVSMLDRQLVVGQVVRCSTPTTSAPSLSQS